MRQSSVVGAQRARPAFPRVQKTLAEGVDRDAPAAARKDVLNMKATGIVRRIDDLGRVVIPKEIRRTMRIREGDPTLTTLTPVARFVHALMDLSKRIGLE